MKACLPLTNAKNLVLQDLHNPRYTQDPKIDPLASMGSNFESELDTGGLQERPLNRLELFYELASQRLAQVHFQTLTFKSLARRFSRSLEFN